MMVRVECIQCVFVHVIKKGKQIKCNAYIHITTTIFIKYQKKKLPLDPVKS